MIQPRTLKGFRDYLPAVMIPREQLMQTARDVFRRFGFAPIDTPTLEHLDILTGKGSEETDRQLYRFEDAGGRPVGMRFDLTVPLARFAAQHIGSLGTPFKRYHIAPVWRGENPQAGRYREFVQCDFDTIGTTSVMADIEAVTVIDSLFQAIGIDATIAINNRAILTGYLQSLDLADHVTPVLRSLDKLAKIGREKTAAEMVSASGITARQADSVLRLADLANMDLDAVFDALPDVVGRDSLASDGVTRLREIVDGALASGVASSRMKVDVSIARGLDYYTGVIFETTLDDLPSIGSVCSGGRYDNLAGLYTKQDLPGIGASLGLDRLIAALDQLGQISDVRKPCPVIVPYFDPQHRHDYLRLTSNVRAAGIGVEMYPDPKRLGQQLKYADTQGFRLAIVAGGDEWQQSKVQVKSLADKQTCEVDYCHESPEPLIERLRELL